MPAVIPRLIDSCHETDPKISETAHAALDAVTLTIDHTETQKLRKLRAAALAVLNGLARRQNEPELLAQVRFNSILIRF